MPVDEEARAIAHRAELRAENAMAKIESHEDECARRYLETASALHEVKNDVANALKEVRGDLASMRARSYVLITGVTLMLGAALVQLMVKN